MIHQPHAPLFLQGRHCVDVTKGQLGSPYCSRSEDLEPPRDVVGTEQLESLDVTALGAREHDADGRHIRCGKAPAAQDHLYKRAPGASVSVFEGVDSLELGVSDAGLNQWRQVVALTEGGRIVDEPPDFIRWRGDEVSPARVVVVASDPVLHIA